MLFLDQIHRTHAGCTRDNSGSCTSAPETQSTREETSSDADAVQTLGQSRRLDTYLLAVFSRYLFYTPSRRALVITTSPPSVKMATAAESNNSTKKPKKGGKGPGQNSAVRLKTVVRKLPPNLPEDIFWQSVAPWVDDDTCTWKAFHAGKLKGVCVPISLLPPLHEFEN